MPLVNLKTNLTSLKYGKDTIGGGSSGQPYIQTKIPKGFSGVGNTGGPDFLLRGGTLLPKLVVRDVSRLSQMFFNLKSPAGILFTAKQNILSLSNVNSGAGYETFEIDNRSTGGRSAIGRFIVNTGNFLRNNIKINQGIYTPLSTIAQAAGTPLGLHLNKQGINPFTKTTLGSPNGNTPLGLPTYLNVIDVGVDKNGFKGNKSRLQPLLNKINNKTEGNNNLYTYIGGPGAILGVGKTSINMVPDQRTGVNNLASTLNLNYPLRPNSPVNFNTLVGDLTTTSLQFSPRIAFTSSLKIHRGKVKYIRSKYTPGEGENKDISDIQSAYGASTIYFSTLTPEYQGEYINNPLFFNNQGVVRPLFSSVYKSGGLLVTDTDRLVSGTGGNTKAMVFTQEQINNSKPSSKVENPDIQENFIQTLKDSEFASDSIKNYPTSPSYRYKNIETRVNLGNPGAKGNIKSYVIGKRAIGSIFYDTEQNSKYTQALDKINAFPLYKSSGVTSDPFVNDLVKFRIGVIDNKNPNKKTFIHFRAFIDDFSDNYGADWGSQNFMGRGEKFYKYKGFDRNISLSWTVAAQSKQELIPMHQKLNYLASVCAPDYSLSGYMQGNLISLTVGGYLYEQVGIMTGISFGIPQESPWEIGIDDTPDVNDSSVKELPMILKVTGFNFIPIHSFAPRIQQNTYDGAKIPLGGEFISAYGPEQYIGLAAAGGFNNYGDKDGSSQKENINYIPFYEKI